MNLRELISNVLISKYYFLTNYLEMFCYQKGWESNSSATFVSQSSQLPAVRTNLDYYTTFSLEQPIETGLEIGNAKGLFLMIDTDLNSGKIDVRVGGSGMSFWI